MAASRRAASAAVETTTGGVLAEERDGAVAAEGRDERRQRHRHARGERRRVDAGRAGLLGHGHRGGPRVLRRPQPVDRGARGEPAAGARARPARARRRSSRPASRSAAPGGRRARRRLATRAAAARARRRPARARRRRAGARARAPRRSPRGRGPARRRAVRARRAAARARRRGSTWPAASRAGRARRRARAPPPRHRRGSRPCGCRPAPGRRVSPCTCRPRTRTRRPDGSASSSSPSASSPPARVPVTTVPNPLSEKTRSTGRRRRPSAGRSLDSWARARSAARSAPRPSPVFDDTRTTGRPSRNDPATSSRTSISATRLRGGVGDVALGESDEAARDAEQPADVEVLARLRHHGLVGRDHEKRRVDPVRAGEHVADEPLVAGYVHERCDHVVGQGRVREAEVDRDPPLLLLLEAVGVGAGERAHERALAVVDVAGGTDDEGAQRGFSPRGSSRRRRTPPSCGAWRRGRAAPPSRRGR